MKTIGFIGIGQMGKIMIEHLINADAGYRVFANDLNKLEVDYICKKGAIAAPKISDIGKNADIAILMLPNSKIVESVVLGNDGLLESMHAGQVIVDMSSSDMKSTVMLADLAREKGIVYVDAPVSGGKQKAAESSLTIMFGGEEKYFEELYPILKCMGEKIIRVGSAGHGHALKAINNYLSAASLYASSEAMIIADAVGLDLEKSLEVINGSSGQSYSTQYKMPNFILNRKFNTGFSLDLIIKDLKMANDLARDNEIPMILGATVEQVYKSAKIMLDNHHSDHTEIVKFAEMISGKPISMSRN